MEGIESVACLNCGAALTGPYCSSCGQKRPHTDLTLREFLHEATAELLQWEGKIPATLKTLFLQPGRLTLDFLEGRRARWLAPLRVYLICSLVYFVSGPLLQAVTHRSAREIANITLTNPDGSTSLTPEGRRQLEQGLPARIFGRERLERAAAHSAQLNRAIASAFPRAMFVLLPLFALLTNLAWRNRMPRYPAHLYQALHFHGALFGALTVSTVAELLLPWTAAAVIAGVVALAYIGWYALVAFRRAFGESWVRTVAKASVVAVVYCVFLFATSLAILGYAITTM